MRKNMIAYEKQPLFSVMIADAEDHIVKQGETLYDIIGEYDTNIEDILELNPIKNPNKVKPGQKIKVKK
jgi:LysM repeat protein